MFPCGALVEFLPGALIKTVHSRINRLNILRWLHFLVFRGYIVELSFHGARLRSSKANGGRQCQNIYIYIYIYTYLLEP